MILNFYDAHPPAGFDSLRRGVSCASLLFAPAGRNP